MATIITPTRGQPIDVTLISSLVEAVSDLHFTTTPVAIAGLTNTTSTVSGGNAATVVLTSVTKDRVDGIIKFPSGSTGSVTMQINLIALGIA